jgi:hypothetical protein
VERLREKQVFFAKRGILSPPDLDEAHALKEPGAQLRVITIAHVQLD